MNRSVSWIDPDDVQRALSVLAEDPGALASARPRGQLARIEPVKRPSAAPPAHLAPAHLPPPAPPTAAEVPSNWVPPPPGTGQPVAARVDALARWIEGQLVPDRWFVADEDGFVLQASGFDERSVAHLVNGMVPMKADTYLDAVIYQLNDGRTLVARWVPCAFGRVVIGLENAKRAREPALRGLFLRALGR